MSSLIGYASSEDEDVTGDDITGSTQIQSTIENNHFAIADVKGGQPASVSSEVVQSPASGPAQAATSANSDVAGFEDEGDARSQIQALTMPRFPDFDIPRSPSPPTTDSEEVATLAARTRKFERFLELKKQGIHFNDRLAASTAIRNPQLFQKMAEFAGISPLEQYETSIADVLDIPIQWPAGFLEDLIATNDKRLKKERAQRKAVEFISSSKSRS